MSGSDETKTTDQWWEDLTKELRETYASLTREARNIALYARQHDVALDVERPETPSKRGARDELEARIVRVIAGAAQDAIAGERQSAKAASAFQIARALIAAFPSLVEEHLEPRLDQPVTTPSDIERNTYTADRALGLHTARLVEQDQPVDREATDEDVNELIEMPRDLLAVLRDPSIIIRQDAAVFELIAKWQSAHSPTMAGQPVDRASGERQAKSSIKGACAVSAVGESTHGNQDLQRDPHGSGAAGSSTSADVPDDGGRQRASNSSGERDPAQAQDSRVAVEHPVTGERPERKMSVYEDGERGGVLQPETGERERKPQRQDSLTDQLASLIPLAEREGCYDAADYLRGFAELPVPEREPLQDGADQHGPNHPAHKHPRQLGDGPMCDCFREGWDSCDSLANARRAKSAQYLRENPDPPLQDGGERERWLDEIEDSLRQWTAINTPEDRARAVAGDRLSRLREHPHQDVELEKTAEAALGSPIKTDKSFVAVLAENYRFQLENAAKLVQARREVEAEVERLQKTAKKLMGAAAILLFVEHDTERPERMSENARGLLAAKDELRRLLAPSPDDRGGERCSTCKGSHWLNESKLLDGGPMPTACPDCNPDGSKSLTFRAADQSRETSE